MENRALSNRKLDFWLLGGASILVWATLLVANRFSDTIPTIRTYIDKIPWIAASLVFVCNYPHFLASYRLAYFRGGGFIRRNSINLVYVPIGLIAIILVAFFWYNIQIDSPNTIDKMGEWIMGNMIVIMYFTVGWHYTKQTYGCVMVYANYDNYKLSKYQRNILKYNLLGIWWITFIYNNLDNRVITDWDIPFHQLGFPIWVYQILKYSFFTSALLVGYSVFYRNWKQNGQIPSINMIVPMVAMYVWWLPQFRQYDFYFYLSPFFHSLQYLAFVYKVENKNLSRVKRKNAAVMMLIVGLIIAGWAGFEGIPKAIDYLADTGNSLGIPFFFAAFAIFINIHHYFIDNVIWRLKDPKIKEYLLA